MGTKISLLRSDSQGLQGTIANAKCHAQAILPFIEAMQGAVKHLGFKNWVQGNNVHDFYTHDGRRLTMRPICQDADPSKPFYHGVRLSLKLGRATADEHRLIEIDDPADVPRLLEIMRAFAQPTKGRLNSGPEAVAAKKKA